MSDKEFLLREYDTLREEIKDTKARIFRLAGLGVVAMPAAHYLAQTYQIQVLILSLPVLICILLLLFLAESRSLMRCGAYIKDCIEPHLAGRQGDNTGGWEHWLSAGTRNIPDRRFVDKLVAMFFYLMFAFYYVAAVHLSVTSASGIFGLVGKAVVLAIYIAIGILIVGLVIWGHKYSTSTSWS